MRCFGLGLFLVLSACVPSLGQEAQSQPAPPAEPATTTIPLRVRARKPGPKRVPGIHPVYELDGRWAVIDRFGQGSKRSIKPKARFLVVGSRAADVLSAAGFSTTNKAACGQRQPAPTPIVFLAKKGKERIGTPIIAIAISGDRAKVDPRKARLLQLYNQVAESTYGLLDESLRRQIVHELRSGDFQVHEDDSWGQNLAQDPKPDRIQLKFDFGSSIPMAGSGKAFVLVDGAQLSKTYRRCLRLFIDNRPAGNCAEMPYALMAETNALDFVVYDPDGAGAPFLLAYTVREPLWGHERWGFRITPKGPRRFLMDALDPKCRERF